MRRVRGVGAFATALATLGITGAAVAAPYAVLASDPLGIELIDLASVRRDGPLVRYQAITLMNVPPEHAGPGIPDEVRHKRETDCPGHRRRLLETAIASNGGPASAPPWAEPGDWTEIDPVELKLICNGSWGGERLPSVEAARAELRKAAAQQP